MPALLSSNLASVSYDPESREMTIAFKSGAVYHYADVDEGTYDGLLAAPSPGKFFASEIRDAFSFTKG